MAPFDLSFWHATTKTLAYFWVFGFFIFCYGQKVTLHRSKTKFLIYNGKSIFLNGILFDKTLHKTFLEK